MNLCTSKPNPTHSLLILMISQRVFTPGTDLHEENQPWTNVRKINFPEASITHLDPTRTKQSTIFCQEYLPLCAKKQLALCTGMPRLNLRFLLNLTWQKLSCANISSCGSTIDMTWCCPGDCKHLDPNHLQGYFNDMGVTCGPSPVIELFQV